MRFDMMRRRRRTDGVRQQMDTSGAAAFAEERGRGGRRRAGSEDTGDSGRRRRCWRFIVPYLSRRPEALNCGLDERLQIASLRFGNVAGKDEHVGRAEIPAGFRPSSPPRPASRPSSRTGGGAGSRRGL
ncbi:hypothetical protein BRADI_3g27395v3 [Brachypodium distachyon]|uniref:Uncharacterized protein n=1 Tax=Brachypodium distachyon TaxID=15368 RepID=A0A2K2CZI6_BRADI|nr:hypothetical protein BRADI_3g27395v3 [Brachypodium distachyon]